jgi:CRP-like cAMP-binding protein
MVHGPSPSRNHLLAALPRGSYKRVLPHLEPVPLPAGRVLHAAGDVDSDLYFITDGLVSRRFVAANGDCAEFALAGNEGVIGMGGILGGASTPSQAVVVSPGFAYRLAAGFAKHELHHDAPLAQQLYRYTLALIAQAGQVATCNRHHSAEQRLCRWILTSLDRLGSSDVCVSHVAIARMLGVRREAVSTAAARLRRAGLIRYGHRHISVIDRAGLEARACECYASIKQEYSRLL